MMTTSERIKLISDIADQFCQKDWSLIDLTLRQFNLPWTDQWSGDMQSYIIAMIEEANDEVLFNLANHLKIDSTMSSDNKSIPTSKVKELISEIELQKAIMISVSTGGSRIQEVNNEYKERRLKILSLLDEAGLQDPNPFKDLWNWYGRWSDGSLPTYQSRRTYLSDLFQPLLDNLVRLTQRKKILAQVKPTGWERVDRNIDKINHLIETATNEEDFQAVGLICRESLISLAQAVYDPELHLSVDGIDPSETDAKRMLENYITSELTGDSNEEIRRYAKNAYQLSVTLQHKRNANFRQAALCVEATRSLINIIAIISGHRDP